MSSGTNVVELIEYSRRGDRSAQSDLVDLMYPALDQIAQKMLASHGGDLQLNPADLIQEAYLKLISQDVEQGLHSHFLAVASKLMRDVLINALDQASRVRGTAKKIVDEKGSSTSDSMHWDVGTWLKLDRLLDKLEELDPLYARIVEARYFGGLTLAETAVACNVSEQSVTRTWRFCKSWLNLHMADEHTLKEAEAVAGTKATHDENVPEQSTNKGKQSSPVTSDSIAAAAKSSRYSTDVVRVAVREAMQATEDFDASNMTTEPSDHITTSAG